MYFIQDSRSCKTYGTSIEMNGCRKVIKCGRITLNGHLMQNCIFNFTLNLVLKCFKGTLTG